MKALIASAVLACTIAIGVLFQSPPYRLNHLTQPCDQQALIHRDSAYSSSTWVASPGENFFQLRFFDRVEGGVCLRPSWTELRALAAQDPRLAHLAGTPEATLPGEKTWRFDWLPDPGTLPNTKYVNLFPAGVLLNQPLMAAAELAANGAPDAWRQAKPNILVVGLGSGVGIAVLTHHFPEASITVVDIDRVVIELVHDHYPLLRWLETQKTSDGRARLQLITRDARQFIRSHPANAAAAYDLIILDAYTSGSTIPPHLMTREFYGECAAALRQGGLVLSNIIASYDPPEHGNKHLVLGGAIRSQLAAGLTHVHNLPIPLSPTSFVGSETRNNVVLASAVPIGPRSAAKAWERLKAFVPFPELKRGEPAYTTQIIALTDGTRFSSATVPFELVKDGAASWFKQLKSADRAFAERRSTNDPAVIDAAVKQVQEACTKHDRAIPLGWAESTNAKALFWQRTDWVEHSREVWAAAIDLGKDAVSHDGQALLENRITNAPLFTDARPNADIYNGG